MLDKVEIIKDNYKPGTKIKCIHLDDPYHPIPEGTIGTVDHVDDEGTIHMKWENGSSLGLVPGEDKLVVFSSEIKDKYSLNGLSNKETEVKENSKIDVHKDVQQVL